MDINCKGETMNKSELVSTIASRTGSTKADASRFLEAFMAAVTDSLKNKVPVGLTGFGNFSAEHRAERKGRNPQTGAEIRIKARKVVKFSAGKDLKEAIQ